MRKFTLIKENMTIGESDIRDSDTLYILIKESDTREEKVSDKEKRNERNPKALLKTTL
jgi:hypothetical protein